MIGMIEDRLVVTADEVFAVNEKMFIAGSYSRGDDLRSFRLQS